ncbi:DUF1624 domain-containing protein [Candidatus Woesearchaeota archaeon]|nr:DUF1624 domain-containing protein [Candidatus Woesearchaeota archaeon]
MRSRIPEVDFLRGIAILMMVFYHFMWDLWYLDVIDASVSSGFFNIFQTLTAGLFIFIVGVSLVLSYNLKKRRYRYFLIRGLKIFAGGLVITAGSLAFSPDAFVFFGILHFIGLSIIIAALFVRFTYFNLLIGTLSIAAGIYLEKFIFSFPWLVWLGFRHPVSTLDLYPLLPWIGLVFLGMFAGKMLYPKGNRAFSLKIISLKIKNISRPVQYMGRHAFLIYFLHLPVVFAAAYLISLYV